MDVSVEAFLSSEMAARPTQGNDTLQTRFRDFTPVRSGKWWATSALLTLHATLHVEHRTDLTKRKQDRHPARVLQNAVDSEMVSRQGCEMRNVPQVLRSTQTWLNRREVISGLVSTRPRRSSTRRGRRSKADPTCSYSVLLR